MKIHTDIACLFKNSVYVENKGIYMFKNAGSTDQVMHILWNLLKEKQFVYLYKYEQF